VWNWQLVCIMEMYCVLCEVQTECLLVIKWSSVFKFQRRCLPSFLWCIFRTLPSVISDAVPCLHPVFTTRTSGHSQGTFRAIHFFSCHAKTDFSHCNPIIRLTVVACHSFFKRLNNPCDTQPSLRPCHGCIGLFLPVTAVVWVPS
jgi:hypothetical protein